MFYILLNFVKPSVEGQSKYYRVVNRADRLLLFLMKMKLGLPFTALYAYLMFPNKLQAIFF